MNTILTLLLCGFILTARPMLAVLTMIRLSSTLVHARKWMARHKHTHTTL